MMTYGWEMHLTVFFTDFFVILPLALGWWDYKSVIFLANPFKPMVEA